MNGKVAKKRGRDEVKVRREEQPVWKNQGLSI
jgi:hypothetical protein